MMGKPSVTFTACDPGSKAVGVSKQRLDAAELLLGGRSGIAVSAAENGVPAGAARCVARLFALSPGAITTFEQAGRGTLPADAAKRVRDLVRQEALTCRDNPKAGLL